MNKISTFAAVTALLMIPISAAYSHSRVQGTAHGEPVSKATVVTAAPLFEMDLKMTGVTEYGTSFNGVMTGKTPPPAEGARFDVTFEGTIRGPKLNGKVTGVDYLSIRADGRTDLNIYLTITTNRGQKIAVHMTGNAVGRPGSTIIDIRENGTMFTSAKDYKWVNGLQGLSEQSTVRLAGSN